MEKVAHELVERLKGLMEKDINIVGFSQKIRDNKIRIYLAKEPTVNMINTLKIGGHEYEVEYVVIGKVKILPCLKEQKDGDL